jgi:hypothetical protein
MESALLSLFSLTFLVFAFGIAISVSALRTLIEAICRKTAIIIPDKWEGVIFDVWNEWVLPAAPIVVGAIIAFLVKDYPYPEEFAASGSGRAFFGLIAGFCSSSVYRFAKYHIKKYLPQEVKDKIDSVAGQLNQPPKDE